MPILVFDMLIGEAPNDKDQAVEENGPDEAVKARTVSQTAKRQQQ